jgi:transcription elongation factor GreB
VSKAFTSEEAPDLPEVAVGRPTLPPGVPNYVTERGLAALRAELESLLHERPPPGDKSALARATQRRVALEERIASAVRPPPPASLDVVRFGAWVTLAGAAGERRFQIVGVDEADPALGKLAFVSPLARALVGRRVGDSVRLRAPRGEEELEIEAVRYDDAE